MPQRIGVNEKDLPWIAPHQWGGKVEVKVLGMDSQTGEGMCLMRMPAGVRFEPHSHPGAEQFYIVEGELVVGGETCGPGTYVLIGGGQEHGGNTERGCTSVVYVKNLADWPVPEVQDHLRERGF